MREIQYHKAINEAFIEEMERDETVYLMGESLRGANYPHSEGLAKRFGDQRVLDTPICEAAFCGAAVASAMTGYRPIVDLMFIDFMYTAADEILLKAPQWRFMHGGKVNVPVVFMGAAGGGMKLANEHSQIPSSIILHSPGIKLAVPSTPYDAKGLMKTAIRDNNPVMYFWHKQLMAVTGEVPEEDYTIPFGVADVKREGTDVTVVAYSYMVQLALEVAKKLEGEISVEVVDPRTLEPFDLDAVLKSVEKTNRLVIVDEDTERCSFASELAAQVVDKGFTLLDEPIKRVCAGNYPIPGGYMEQHVLPSVEKIEAAIRSVAV